MFPNSNIVSSRFNEDGKTTTGTMMHSPRERCDRNDEIDRVMYTIEKLAEDNGKDYVVTKILADSSPYLATYVTSQNEVPERDINQLAFQAAVLRMKDIAGIQDTLDTTNHDAQMLLECSEDKIINRQLPQKKYILPAQAQGALNYVIQGIIDKHTASGGTGKISDIMKQMQINSPSYFTGNPDTDYTQPVFYSDYPDIADLPVASTGVEGPGGPTTPVAVMPEVTAGTGQTTSGAPNTANNSNGGVLGWVDKALQVVKDAGGTIQTFGNNVSDAIGNVEGKVTNATSDIATKSFKQALINNLPLIVGIVIGLTLLILTIVYFAKNKHK